MALAGSQARVNLAAGFVARLYIGILNLVTVPFLLRWLGAEAFGLIGLAVTMQALFYILDAGLSSAVTRELARNYDDRAERRTVIQDCKGIEAIYLRLSPVIVIASCLLGLIFVLNWRHGVELSTDEMLGSVALMSLTIGFQWLTSFYSAALYGLNGHLSVAVLQSAIWTARSLGGLAVIYVAGPHPVYYFSFQLLAMAVGAFAMHRALVARIPDWVGSSLPSFRETYRKWRRVAIMVSGVSAGLLAFNQVDKFVLGMQFDVGTFGYYTLAWQIAGALYLVYNPVYNAYLPAISQAAGQAGGDEARRLAREGALLMALLVVPLAAVIVGFSREVLFVWTGSWDTADKAGDFLRLAFGGAAFHALFFVPYAVQVAYGNTRGSIVPLVASLVIMPPLMMFLAASGAGPAAVVLVWTAFSAIFLITTAAWTSWGLLSMSPLKWLWDTLILPLAPVVVAFAIADELQIIGGNRWQVGLGLIATYVLALIGLLMLNGPVRRMLVDNIAPYFQNGR